MSVVIAYVNLKRYEFVCSDDRLEYYFDSVGPKGVIKKVVRFEHVNRPYSVYSLGFGDLNEMTGFVSHSIKSNNGDREIVMATIAAIVLDFNHAYPDSLVYATGYNKARTRLYQMAIASYLPEISLMFHVFGYIDGGWEEFKLTKNYNGFCIERKLTLKLK